MVDRLLNYQPIRPSGKIEGGVSKKQNISKDKIQNVNFSDILSNKLQNTTNVKFSSHAETRIKARNIKFTSEDMKNIERAVNDAGKKGARESLLIMKDMALIVSVKNKTVITAIDKKNMKNNVFTNIDSAVII